jgi:uncharacterized phage infection (PIP) family protein YhgE
LAFAITVSGLVAGYFVLYTDKCNLARSLRDAEAALAEQRERTTGLQLEANNFRESNHTLTSARAALERSNADNLTRVDQLQTQVQTLTAASGTLSATKVTLENAKAIVTKQVQQLQLQNDTLGKANRELTTSSADLNQQLSQSTAQIQRLEKENKDLTAAMKELRIKAETPIERPIPIPVQTAGTITVPANLSWGGGDINLAILSHPTSALSNTVKLESKVGDDTLLTYVEMAGYSKPQSVTVKGLRGQLTFEIVKATFSTSTFGLLRSAASVQFKASYCPTIAPPPTPTNK